MATDNKKKKIFINKWLTLYLVLLFVVIGAGWFLTEYLGDKARQEILEYNESRMLLHSSHLTAEFEKIEKAVKAMSGSPWIAAALVSRKEQDIANANAALDRYNFSMNSSVSYIMDSSGKTIASSNRNDPDSFVGKSYQFRPYFTQAIKGASGRYFALGATSLKRGFYASSAVRDGKGEIIGVAVIKQDLDVEESHLTKYPYCFVLDPNGIIFLSGMDELKFKSLWPVSRETQLALLKSKQFGEREFDSVLPREVNDGMEVALYGEIYLASRKFINSEGWSIVLMTTTERIILYKLTGIVITVLICSLIVVLLIINYNTSMLAEKIRENEQKFRAIFEQAFQLVGTMTTDGILLSANKAALTFSGVKEEDVIGKPFWEAPWWSHSPELQEKLSLAVKKAAGGEFVRFDATHPVPDGSIRYVDFSLRPVLDDEGRVIFLVPEGRDITERRLAEAALLESEKKYRNILENIEDGYYEVDIAGNFTFFNYATCRILGYSAEELMDKNNREYVDEENAKKIFKVYNEVYRTGIPTRAFDWELIRKDGSKCFIETGVSLITDSNNVKTGFRGIARDITERKRAEEELENSFKRLRAALGAIVQTVSVTVETRDPYTAGHQKRVADLSRAIASELGLDANTIDGVRMAGVIHDLGKIGIPAEILSKPTKLTEIEYRLIKTHPVSGYDIIKDVEFPWPIANIVLQHHERYNGSGYPAGLKGEGILLEARIIGVADVVEAIASYRPYRPAQGEEIALDEIIRNRGILYDPAVVDACLRLFREKGYKF